LRSIDNIAALDEREATVQRRFFLEIGPLALNWSSTLYSPSAAKYHWVLKPATDRRQNTPLDTMNFSR
jgi:hypothetical protein